MANEKQKVYVKGQWLSIKDVSIKYGKHLTATLIEILRWLKKGEPVHFLDFVKELNFLYFKKIRNERINNKNM
jgi:hypothetical protein